jgi:hypothetical protein
VKLTDSRNIVILLLGHSSDAVREHFGRWVVRYDPEWHLPDGDYDGGCLVTTAKRGEATRYTLREALELYRSGPTCSCHRRLPSGGRARPLMGFNVEIYTAPREEGEHDMERPGRADRQHA